MMAYNATAQASTGCTPNMLCFGEEATLPVDIMFGTGSETRPWIRPDGSVNYHDYVEQKRHIMVKAFAAARATLRKSALRQKKGYNTHVKPRQFSVGEWVLKWYKPAADKPLGRGWIGPYVVTKVRGDVVYEIQLHPKAPPHTVHVDHLKPCFAFEGRDNWVKNPDYVPKAHPRSSPKDRDLEMDEILSQEGDDDIDREALLSDLRRKLPDPVAGKRGIVPGRGQADRSPPADAQPPVGDITSQLPAPRLGKGQKSVDSRLTPPKIVHGR